MKPVKILNSHDDLFDFRATKKNSSDFAQLHTYELINYIIHNNPALLSPKAIAVAMKVDLSTVYRWGENSKTSGIDMTLERLIDFAKITHSENVIIKYFNARTKR